MRQQIYSTELKLRLNITKQLEDRPSLMHRWLMHPRPVGMTNLLKTSHKATMNTLLSTKGITDLLNQYGLSNLIFQIERSHIPNE